MNKGYLTTDNSPQSTAIAKSKTVGLLSNTTIYDNEDIVFPSSEINSIFLTTAIIVTPNQTRGICTPQDGVNCTVNNQCPTSGTPAYVGSGGVYTGECNEELHLCTLKAWCPMEMEHTSKKIWNIGTGTIFLDINVLFPTFNAIVSNTYDQNSNGMPINGYNLFVIDDIVKNATNGTINTNDISHRGIIILMVAEWDCNLNLPINFCVPQFSYYRLDGQSDSITSGFNFRNTFYSSNGSSRLLIKRYGVRIIFVSYGTATKTDTFSIVLTISFGVIILLISIMMAKSMVKCKWFFAPNIDKHDTLIDTDTMQCETNQVPVIYSNDEGNYNSTPPQTLLGFC